jgi:hypothetical protein
MSGATKRQTNQAQAVLSLECINKSHEVLMLKNFNMALIFINKIN